MTTVPPAVAAFAEEVGPTDPVVPVGGRTQWEVGGDPDQHAREVHAPAGILDYEPAEMTVRCLAGTTVAELDAAVSAHGQMVPLDPRIPEQATVGGVLAVGHSGIRRLRYGPIRDLLLQVRMVAATGAIVTAGGAVVKNVSGFDLCRLVVGSLGTLGLLAEVVLRVVPRPVATVWLRGEDDPSGVRHRLFRPSSILWDGTSVWVLLEGRAADVAAERSLLGGNFEEVAGPPSLPAERLSLRPANVKTLEGTFVAEIGVGTVHGNVTLRQAPLTIHPRTQTLQRDIKRTFDPQCRFNPGRWVVA